MPAGAGAWVRLKPYGNGLDTEVNVTNWPDLCYFIHGNPINPNQCHLEGLDSKGYSRVQCEMLIVETLSHGAGKCPVGVWRTNEHNADNYCYQDDPYPTGGMSCDHFGDTITRDDPQTPPFEGEPKVCGNYRDPYGKPMAGFFWIGHGDGWMKACLPDYTGCSRAEVRVVH